MRTLYILLLEVCALCLLVCASAHAAPPLNNAMQADILEQTQKDAPDDMQGEEPPPKAGKNLASHSVAVSREYVLGIGDHILLNVYGDEDISGTYAVSSTGIASIPLIGDVQAAGSTVGEMEEAVRAKLAQGYFKNPKVSIEISNYRPFFILGEVAKPGSYPYVNGMTVLNAVALAGGYTYRASVSRIKIVHASDAAKTERPAEETESVAPGDIIRVPERYF